MRVRADGAGKLAHAIRSLRFFEPLLGAAKFVVHQRELQAESDRLRVNAVAAADHRRVFEFHRPPCDHRPQFPQVGEQKIRRLGHLHGERRIEHVRRGHPLMHPPARRPDIARDIFEKCDDVVIRAQFDLRDFLEIEFRFRPDRLRILLRHHPDLGLCFAGESLDLQPDFVFALIRPDGGHFGTGITFDHPADVRQPRPIQKENFAPRRAPKKTHPAAGGQASDGVWEKFLTEERRNAL
jgi:hypothetical protein